MHCEPSMREENRSDVKQIHRLLKTATLLCWDVAETDCQSQSICSRITTLLSYG